MYFFPFFCIWFTECPSSGNIPSSLSESDNSIQVTCCAQVRHVKDKHTQQVSKNKILKQISVSKYDELCEALHIDELYYIMHAA